ncbi:MAG: oligosaccharide flippase family protein [Thermodesulfobacteriota bacterium]
MDKKETVSQKLFKNASWLLGGKMAAGIFATIEVVILARMLGVEDYGLLVLVVVYVDIMDRLFDLRVWETATKYIGSYLVEGENDKVLSVIKFSFLVNIFSGFLALVITILTAKLAEKYFIHSPGAFYFIYIYAFSMLFNTANYTSDAILRIFDKFKSIAFISTFYNFFKLAVVLIVLYLGLGIEVVLFGYVAASFLSLLIRLTLVTRTLNENNLKRWWSAKLGLIRDKWKEIGWFLGNTTLAGTLKMANDEYLGVLLLGYWSGKDSVAYYKIAKSFVKLLLRIEDPLYETIYPELVRFSKLNALGELKNLIIYSVKKLLIYIVPVIILVLIFAGLIINAIYGKEYLDAVNALRVVTVAGLISLSIFWINPVLLSFGKPGIRNVVDIITIISFVILLFILVRDYSYMGAAFSFLGSVVIRLIVSIFALKVSIKNRKEEFS